MTVVRANELVAVRKNLKQPCEGTTAARLTSRFHGTTSIKWRLHDYSNGIVKDQNIDESRNTEACDCHVIVRDDTRAAVF